MSISFPEFHRRIVAEYGKAGEAALCSADVMNTDLDKGYEAALEKLLPHIEEEMIARQE